MAGLSPIMLIFLMGMTAFIFLVMGFALGYALNAKAFSNALVLDFKHSKTRKGWEIYHVRGSFLTKEYLHATEDKDISRVNEDRGMLNFLTKKIPHEIDMNDCLIVKGDGGKRDLLINGISTVKKEYYEDIIKLRSELSQAKETIKSKDTIILELETNFETEVNDRVKELAKHQRAVSKEEKKPESKK